MLLLFSFAARYESLLSLLVPLCQGLLFRRVQAKRPTLDVHRLMRGQFSGYVVIAVAANACAIKPRRF